MFTGTVENKSPTRQRVNESQSVHSLALRACNGAKHGAVQSGLNNLRQAASSLSTCHRVIIRNALPHG